MTDIKTAANATQPQVEAVETANAVEGNQAKRIAEERERNAAAAKGGRRTA